ncbi:uncharacterized protein EURHEDRAFT_413413 [Aspergillus ruber CBS 135680]|uniref:Spindle pole body-associated protein cut12 domain-containing protein n=1 Tax=Aspergillus ruber (strain CBS 135680) TaxID=1388766 RepID=A0A017SBK4_ASPRC|nr:uncharacterized protein EURHEDRAFT_413413 [Aspergillus ruber CBS 135680]EYE94191.1 hypothetical protein EURHEDRAFT_413413 [Aspergillus ruber CBS 135680]
MLGWMTGQNQNEQFAHSADNSKVLEAPETPAPVFALRAFKSALFGTPAPEEEDRDRVLRAKEQQSPIRARVQADPQKDHSTGNLGDDKMPTLQPDTAPTGNTMVSPTKSILVTPGTISNRRKTVSFGDGVVDNERKQESPSKAPSLRTPTNLSTSPSSQWASGSSDSKPRSKLTQALLDSREKRSSKDFQPTQTSKSSETRSGGNTSKMVPQSAENDDNDETLNMSEPRSQSGKYWKTEFDKYRTRTDWEIKRLVQYRSVAKSYAKKKDEEAVRLAEKLKQEEEKVAEMERHVSQLASTMVTEGDKHDKERLIQDLTKQTALALQYKHRVTMLRKALEKHGVVSNEMEDIKEQSDGNVSADKTTEELRKSQQALEQANAKIKAMQNQRSDLSQLHDLSESSEQKASELEKENVTLKQTLARFKSEMTKYEGRRKEKEAKLKQREAKLELRIREYRERLRTVTQRHRESQESFKELFEEERHSLLEQIERLKLTLGTLDRLPDFESGRLTLSPRKDYTGVNVYDFGQSSPQRGHNNDETEELGDPPSPSPRSKERRYRQLRSAIDDPLDLRRAAQAMGIDIDGDGNDPSIYAEEDEASPQRQPRRFNHVPDDEGDVVIPPSSPPDLSSIKSSYNRRSLTKLDNDLDDQHATSRDRYLAGLEEEKQTRPQQRRRRSPTKYGLDALSKQQRLGLSESQRDAMPIDRKIAAQARLKRKEANRKAKEEAIGAF